MEKAVPSPSIVRFGTFEVDLLAGELRKAGVKLKLTGQPFQVLAILLERPGQVVTREELQKRLWSDTFVDFDHNLNTAINKIREVLGDSAESPRFVETLPRKGYRFVALGLMRVPEAGSGHAVQSSGKPPSWKHTWLVPSCIVLVVGVVLVGAALVFHNRLRSSVSRPQRELTRLTFDDGLQIGATWSPDDRFIAYGSDRGGKFDIWVQQVSGGDPIQITRNPGHNWQPDWSPDGKYIAYRSEEGEGGLFVIPALGGAGLERRMASFGNHPRWSPDSSQILFQTTHFANLNRINVVGLDGSAAREIAGEFITRHPYTLSVAWHPDGKRATIWTWDEGPSPSFWTVPIAGGAAVKTAIPANLASQFGELAATGNEWTLDPKFSWAPSGTAIYFERTLRGSRNAWKMTVDPVTLQATALERLTTGPGLDAELAISSDGNRLAFTGETQHIRAWFFPFDATRGRVTGVGHAVTSPGLEASGGLSLNKDGKNLAYSAKRDGKLDLWEKSLMDSHEVPILADSYNRLDPQWAPDGNRLAYVRESKGKDQCAVWSGRSHNEELLATSGEGWCYGWGWSRDGEEFLISRPNSDTQKAEIWLQPAPVHGQPRAAAQKIVSSPAYNLFQAYFSPDGRWIVFEAVKDPPDINLGVESDLYVIPVPADRGLSSRKANLGTTSLAGLPTAKRSTSFPVVGAFSTCGESVSIQPRKARGEPFGVTAFKTPALMLPEQINIIEMSLTQDLLVLTMQDLAGSIWVLDNVGQ